MGSRQDSDRKVGAEQPSRWQRRFRRIGIIIGVPITFIALLFGWAALNTDSSLYARALIWMQADTDDWQRFPFRVVEPSPQPVVFDSGELPAGTLERVQVDDNGQEKTVSLNSMLTDSGTTAFIVLQNDEILTERYFNGSSRQATQTSFSVAKSFVSTLVGIAIHEGHIGGLDDPITKYLPELLTNDERMGDITIRHLVSMSSGLAYSEAGMPWTDDSRTYYSPDLRTAALSVEVDEAPGTTWLYNNYNPLLLGMVLERATGMPVAEYLETRLWQPMGAEAAGSWSLDSDESGFEKMESGINGRAIDFLKLGWLFLNNGRNGETQVVPENWVTQATAVDTTTDPAPHYQYFWWIDEDRGGYFAEGNHGQFIYVAPDPGLVIVRMGSRYGYDNWQGILAQIIDQLAALIPPTEGSAAPSSFSIPVGSDGVTYDLDGSPPSGPSAFAIRDDGSVVVADTHAVRRGEPRLLTYDAHGRPGQIIDLTPLGVASIADVVTDGEDLAILDVLIPREEYRIRVLDPSGQLLATHEIPLGYRFADGLTGLEWDDNGLLLELELGVRYARIGADGAVSPDANLTHLGQPIAIRNGDEGRHMVHLGQDSFEVELSTDRGGVTLVGVAPDGTVVLAIDEVALEGGAVDVNRRVERYSKAGLLLFSTEFDPGEQLVDIARPLELATDGRIVRLRTTESELVVEVLREE